MARYWVYLNDEVSGPFGLEQLIRQRGFSRQTLVCIEDDSGKPKNWISPAEIPELAHIFKAAEEHLAEPPVPMKKASPKPQAARIAKPYAPAVTLKSPKRNTAQLWGWILLASVLTAGGLFGWSLYSHNGVQSREQARAKSLVENVHLPAPSPYSTLPQYFQEKDVHPRWEFEKLPDALYHVTLSWYAPALSVYAFEVNLQAETVRSLNSAASKLLSEGFPAPPAPKAKPAPVAKKTPVELFSHAIESHREAMDGGDFQTIWDLFSQRKKSEMARGGISRDGFIRLQGLTHRVESTSKEAILKSKQQSDTEMLVLLKQTQDGRPDIFVKQLWVFENGEWKLDDEQKRAAASAVSEAPPAAAPGAAAPVAPAPATAPSTPSSEKPVPTTLPGMSN